MAFSVHEILVERKGDQLELATPEITLGPAAVVRWVFLGVQKNEAPALVVKPSTSGLSGSFTYLRRNQNSLIAKGFSAPSGNFEYQAVLVRPDRTPGSKQVNLAESGPGLIRLHREPQRLGQAIRVTLAGDGKTLEVSPTASYALPGDPVLWEFIMPRGFLEDAWVPSIYFNAAPSRGLFFGPFPNLAAIDSALPPGADDPVVRRFLVATPVASGETYNYIATVRGTDSTELVSSDDPVIDTDADPVCVGNC